MEKTVPALQRGIEVMRMLADLPEAARRDYHDDEWLSPIGDNDSGSGAEGVRLVDIQRRTKLPRSSLIRILDTLVACGIVEELPQGKTYRSLMRLVPQVAGEAYVRRQVQAELLRLAEQTSETAEWFVADSKGLMMTEHAHPSAQRVRVLADVGHRFRWDFELDAVTAVGFAFLCETQPDDDQMILSYYRDGHMRKQPMAKLRSRIEAARLNGFDIDPYWNDLGIRRVACVVSSIDQPIGVLSLALSYKPVRLDSPQECLPHVLETAERLTQVFSQTPSDAFV